jgi:integrase/recombinase XerD
VRRSLSHFFDWCCNKGVEIEAVTEPLLAEYCRHLHDSGLALSSCRIAMVHLRRLFRYLHARGKIATNPTELIRGGVATRNIPETLEAAAVSRLLEGIDPTDIPYGARDRAMLEMLYGSGLRVSELTSLRADQINWEESFLRITGKGNKTRYVPLGGMAAKALRHYVSTARAVLEGEHRRVPQLFLSNRGEALTRERIRQIIRKRATEAGLNERVYPHIMRHSFATHLIENGADLRLVQEMLGHESVATTEIYTHIDSSTWHGSILANHPRNK